MGAALDRHEVMQAMYTALNSEEGYHGLKFEWCCKGRHGVIRAVPEDKFNEIATMLVYMFGRKCYWNKKAGKKLYDIEFVPTTKTSPPPKEPWSGVAKRYSLQISNARVT